MERGIKSQLFAAIALLACVGAMGLGVEGCHKQQPKEEEKVFAVKRFPRLNPKEGLLGRWEWGFTLPNQSLPPEYCIETIPEKEGYSITFSLHKDGSWEWRDSRKPALSGPQFTTGHREYPYSGDETITIKYDSVAMLDEKGVLRKKLIFVLHDTCMLEGGAIQYMCGEALDVYYLRERE